MTLIKRILKSTWSHSGLIILIFLLGFISTPQAQQVPSTAEIYKELQKGGSAKKRVEVMNWAQSWLKEIEADDRLASLYHEKRALLLRTQSKYDSALYHVQVALNRLPTSEPSDVRAGIYYLYSTIYFNLTELVKGRSMLDSAKQLATSLSTRTRLLYEEVRYFGMEGDSINRVNSLRQGMKLALADTTPQGIRHQLYGYDKLFVSVRKYQKPDSVRRFIEQVELALLKVPKTSKYQVRLTTRHINFFFAQEDYAKVLETLVNLDELIPAEPKRDLKIVYYGFWLDLWVYPGKDFRTQNRDRFLYTPKQAIEYLSTYYPKVRHASKVKILNWLLRYYKSVGDWKNATSTSEKLHQLETSDFQEKIESSFIKDRELTKENNRLTQVSQQSAIDLRNEQLREARLSQRFLIAGILLVLIFGYFIYRSSRQRKQQNLLLAQQKADIEKMDELKSKFFINISHELRTPLTLILGNTQNSIKGKFGELGERNRKALKNIEANSRRIFSLVQDMLDLSKLESGSQQLSIRPVNLQEKINSVASLFDYQLSSKALEVKQKGITENDSLYLDPFKFETILFNLIGNAIKYSYNHTDIIIQLTETEEQVELSIANQGEGIPETDLPYLFDRFFQSGDADSGEGTGIGLALTKELVELHQGTIKVSSELTGETRFALTFKKGKAHFDPAIVQEEVEVSPQLSPSQNGLSSILVVEDNPEMRHYVQEVLSNHFKVFTAANGRVGLELLKEEQPDLIITDFMMPEMNGPEFFRKVRAQVAFADIPIIFLTARAIATDRQGLLMEGVDDYLLKPFEDETLLNRVQNLLNLKTERGKYRAASESTDQERDFIDQAKTVTFKSLSDTKLTPAVLADTLSISERSLYRKVKEATGYTPLAFVKELRLQEARRLLTTKAYYSIAEVALAVGFEDPSYFSKNYKNRFGKLPSEE